MNNRNLFILSGVVILAGLAIWYSGHRSMSGDMPMVDHESSSVPMVAEIKIPDLNTLELLGESRFVENCAACHGENAAGREGVAPPLIHKIYEPSHHADISFQLAAKNGVRAHHWPYGDMPPVPSVSETDVENIIAYIRTLQRANGIL
ncbi:MAG: cytochrome c [Lentilitoribacter sp.]